MSDTHGVGIVDRQGYFRPRCDGLGKGECHEFVLERRPHAGGPGAEPDPFTTEIRAAFRSLRSGGVMSTTVDTASEIRSFHIEIPEEQIDDLRRRIAAIRWPTKELVRDRSQRRAAGDVA
jgi:hypothetical protein